MDTQLAETTETGHYLLSDSNRIYAQVYATRLELRQGLEVGKTYIQAWVGDIITFIGPAVDGANTWLQIE